MERNEIRAILREFIAQENQPDKQPDKPKKKKVDKHDKEYAYLQNVLGDDSLLKTSRVMGAAGLGNPDDAGDRRAFNAKLYKEPNENGSIRKFDDRELAAVTKVVSNPVAFLGKEPNKRD